MDYRMLYENLVAEAEENGLGGEFVDWGISISKWRADPVAIALYGWLLENEPEGMAAKSERQIDWEMGIVGMASSRRREEAVKSWRRSHGAAERENGGFFVTLGLERGAQCGERGHDRGDSRSGVLLGASGRCSKPHRGQREPF